MSQRQAEILWIGSLRLTTEKRRIMVFVILALVVCCHVFANGDPVVRYSSINRVANPEPLSISEIRIDREQVNITHVDGYNCFDITYFFRNASDKDFPEIHYGFPIDYLAADEQEIYMLSGEYYSESQYETGWCDKLIKDISFQFNDSVLQYHAAKESVRQAGYDVEIYGEDVDSIPVDAVNRRWYYTKFSMAPKSEAVFNVRYKVYANSEMPLYGDYYSYSQYARRSVVPDKYVLNHPLLFRYLASSFTILYDFSPAKHFGNGRDFVIEVDIDLSNLDNPYVRLAGMWCYLSHLKRYIYAVKSGEIDPINLKVNFASPNNKEQVERLISPFIISSDKYDVHQSQSTVDIEFREPIFVSELVCDIDTAQIISVNSSITYSDGRVEEYCHEQAPPSELNGKVESPVILTITDFYHNGNECDEVLKKYVNWTGNFDDRHFKIKKIRLDFNLSDTSVKSDVSCRNIRLLDSRFVK